MRYYFVLILSAILFYSCNSYDSSKATDFFLIYQNKSDTGGAYEAFVISNLPKDTMLLKKYIENYNLRTIPVNVLKNCNGRYIRVFYRESEFLTRDYDDGAKDKNPRSSYTYQDFSNYSDDLIMETEFFKWDDDTYRYSINLSSNISTKKTIIIHDLDSFYRAKWIETADIDTTIVK